MSLNVTPGQFNQRAHFYDQLGQLTGAGLGVVAALGMLQRKPPAASYRRPIQRVLNDLNGGCTLTESLERAGHWLPEFDIALLQAGEHSGRLEAAFRLLADYYRDRARMARQVIGDLAYPVFLFHFMMFTFLLVQFFRSPSWVVCFGITLAGLLALYVIVALVIYATQSQHGEAWRGWIEAVLRPIPLLGTGRHYLALSRLAAALEALLSAGVTIIEAWELAASASGSPALRRAVIAWRPLVNGGQTPAEVVSASPRFPELFAGQYATGEVSGKLEDTLQRLRQYYQEEGARKLHAVARWTPKAVYLFVALMIAAYVVHFWMQYFATIRNAGGF